MLSYIIRLDDACPYMNLEKWDRMESLLDQYNIKPIVGIIPESHDKEFNCLENHFFWSETAKRYVNKSWVIAEHGCHHVYQQNLKSEFVGLSYKEQEFLIRTGYNIMCSHGIIPSCFFAPAHSFDDTTIDVCRDTGYFSFISDGRALFPYVNRGMLFLPTLFDSPHAISPVGIFTFVLHPNNMDDRQFDALEYFLLQHKNKFSNGNIIWDVVNLKRKRNIIDFALDAGIQLMRKLR